MEELRKGQILTEHQIRGVFFKREFCTDVKSEEWVSGGLGRKRLQSEGLKDQVF